MRALDEYQSKGAQHSANHVTSSQKSINRIVIHEKQNFFSKSKQKKKDSISLQPFYNNQQLVEGNGEKAGIKTEKNKIKNNSHIYKVKNKP